MTEYRIKQFPTADEEIGKATRAVMFDIVVAAVIAAKASRGAVSHGSVVIALVVSMIPLLTFLNLFSVAIPERIKRRRFMKEGRKAPGEIINVRDETRTVQIHDVTRVIYRYVYTVRFTDGSGFDFETQGYARPVHKILATSYVTVYSDSTGRQHFISDFQVKRNLNDPGPFSHEGEGLNSFWRIHSDELYVLVIMVFAVVILLSSMR